MSDSNVREIQLGGKQLVFLFMASVVVAVAIFLLGISVGRGLGTPAEEVPTEAAAVDEPVGEMPPETVTTPDDLSYHDKLQGQTPPPPQPQPVEPEPEPAKPQPTDSTDVAVAKPQGPPLPPPSAASGQSARGTSQASAAQPAPVTPTVKPAPKPAAPPPAGGWYVQVGAFKSRENADRQAADLKAKGFAAFVQSDPGALFRVRIGPFKERPQAERTAATIQKQEGLRPSIGR